MKGSKNKSYLHLLKPIKLVCTKPKWHDDVFETAWTLWRRCKVGNVWKCGMCFVDCVRKICNFTSDMQSFERGNLEMGMTTLQHCFGLFGDDAQSHLIQNLHWRQAADRNTGVFLTGESPSSLSAEIGARCSKQTHPQAFNATTGVLNHLSKQVYPASTTMPHGLRKVSITLLPDCITQEDGALLQICLSQVLAGWGKLNPFYPFFKWCVKKCQEIPIPSIEVILPMRWDLCPLQAKFAIAQWSFKKTWS